MRLKLQLLIYFSLQKHFGPDCNTLGSEKFKKEKFNFPNCQIFEIKQFQKFLEFHNLENKQIYRFF